MLRHVWWYLKHFITSKPWSGSIWWAAGMLSASVRRRLGNGGALKNPIFTYRLSGVVAKHTLNPNVTEDRKSNQTNPNGPWKMNRFLSPIPSGCPMERVQERLSGQAALGGGIRMERRTKQLWDDCFRNRSSRISRTAGPAGPGKSNGNAVVLRQ